MPGLNAKDSELRGPGRPDDGRRTHGPGPGRGVAIIGMSCLFPSAPDLAAYWRNILGKVDAVTDPPPESREAGLYFDPNSSEADRVYCKRGGYLGSLATFDPLLHGIPPVAVGGEPDQWLALQLARDAMADAGCLHLDEGVRRRTAVILGKGTYLNAGNAMAVQHGLVVNQTLEILRALHPEHTAEELESLRRELKRTLPPIGPETVPGLIPNVIVGRIANRLDLMGPTYTVDAACASSMVVVQMAMRDLLNGECDLALAGGSQVWIPMPTLSIFCQLGALSRRQQIRPFDKDADGTLLGEGIGMLVLKRLDDAERDGDRIYAVIRGVGVASDGRGVSVMAPRVEGEELAIRRAYEAAGVSPRSVGLIEAHGTGTPVGDVVEVQALTRVFGPRDGEFPRCALGSVKSMISHTIPAAGVAGIIKVAMSLHHKVLPPTLNCDEPNPKLELEKTPFYLNTAARPWIHGADEPRRAGVNAFGFGGINAHVVLEEYVPAPGIVRPDRDADAPTASAGPGLLPDWDSEVSILAAESPEGLLEAVRRLEGFLGRDDAPAIRLADLAYTLNRDLMGPGADSQCRLALIASSVADLREKLGRAAKRLGAANCRQIRDVSGIYYASEPLGRGGKLAFLFPGEGAQYPNMLADLCLHFPEVRECFDQIDRVYSGHWRGYLPSDHIFPRASASADEEGGVDSRLWDIVGAVEAVLTANQAILILLRRLGLCPDVILGHSTGEFSAVRAAGIFDPEDEDLSDFILKLYRNYEEASQSGVPRAVLLAVGAERERVEAIAREVGGELYVAMDNCPHQVVLVGEREAVGRALVVVQREGLISEHLNFDRAYHTPLFAPYADHLRNIFDHAKVNPPQVPIYSCTTGAAYPDDPDAIRELMVEHWLCPVEFRRTVETLHGEGVRLFVEVGPRGNLSAFVDDILRGRPFCTIPANVQRRSGLTQLNHLVGLLTAHGVNLDLMYLYRRRHPREISFDAVAPVEGGAKPTSRMKLDTGFPAMQVSEEFARKWGEDASARGAPTAYRPEAQEATPPYEVATVPADPVAEAPSQDWPPDPAEADAATGFDLSHPPTFDHRDEPDPGYPPDSNPADDPSSRGAMVGDFLRTMEQFLVVQERVIRDCLGTGSGRAIAPTPGEVGNSPVFDAFEGGSAYPLLGMVVSEIPGEELVFRRMIDPAEDLYLRDHTLGRDVSDADPDLLAIAIMPLTMSLEILAEAAACLMPGLVVVGLRDVRASRWLAFDGGPQEIQVTARRRPGEGAVFVEMRNLTEDAAARAPSPNPVVEATVILGASYPAATGEGARRPVGGRASRLEADLLYSESMFHGPSWQGVSSIEETGADGSVATLSILPPDGFFRGIAHPRFVLDPVALDAAGQVVGFWTIEHLADGQVVFPYHLDALEIYGSPLPAGERASCVASIRLLGGQQVRSDIDLYAADGRPWMRLVGWEDKRFDLPEGFHSLMHPSRRAISAGWDGPVDCLREPHRFHCRYVPSQLPAEGGLWRRVWSSRVLGRGERGWFAGLDAPEGEKLAWLAGRTAAKEAVQELIRRHHGFDIPPADIEIVVDHRGRMTAVGNWPELVSGPPVVSIGLVDGLAVALAGLPPGPGDGEGDDEFRLGVALEFLRSRHDQVAGPSLSAEERELLGGLSGGQVEEWALRFRCAKEAAGEALGGGFGEGSRSIHVEDAEMERGLVFLRLSGGLAEAHPGLAADRIVVLTRRDGDLVVAATSCESEATAHVAAR